MAVEAIKALGQKFVSKINPKKAEKAAEVSIKDGERMIANGQDAAAIQGRAMVKPYQKPEMEKVNLKKENTQAASGNWGDHGGGSDDGYDDIPDVNEARSTSIWDSGW